MTSFHEYCASKKPNFLPLKGTFYGINLTSSGNIRVIKNSGGELVVPENRIHEVEADLKGFLNNGYFTNGIKKAKNISTLIK